METIHLISEAIDDVNNRLFVGQSLAETGDAVTEAMTPHGLGGQSIQEDSDFGMNYSMNFIHLGNCFYSNLCLKC